MRSVVHRRGPATVRANLTPLIDIVFLLIVFFMLVAQITRQRTVELALPEVRDAEVVEIAGEAHAIVNVVPRELMPALGGGYRLGSQGFAEGTIGLSRLAEQLAQLHERTPDLAVLIRASRTERYERVHPVMEAVRDAGIGRVSLVTVPPDRTGM